MESYTFNYNYVNSQNLGVLLSETPAIKKPKMRYKSTEVDGIDGALYEELGYSAYEKTLKLYIKNKSYIKDIQQWLTGSGELILFNEPDKIYDAYLYDEIEYIRQSRFITAEAKFIVQPYKRALQDEYINLGTNTLNNVYNDGNIQSLPIISITAMGNVQLILNNSIICTLDFGETERTLELNSQKQDCYCDGVLANRSMNGEFPALRIQNNIIRAVGTVSEFKIKKGERWV